MNVATTKSAKTTAGRKTPTKRKQAAPARSRQEMIAETAYYLAEKRGFAPDYELQDWFEAERIVQETAPRGMISK